MKKQSLALLCTSALLMGALAGCGESSGATTTVSPTPSAAQTEDSGIITGQIQSIDGNTITLLLGEMTEFQPGQDGGPTGQPPIGDNQQVPDSSAAPGGVGDNQQVSDNSAAPEGDDLQNTNDNDTSSDSVQQPPSGNHPEKDGNRQQPGGETTFTPGIETTTVIVNDNTTITLEDSENTTGSLEDLTEGAVVTISLNADGSAAEITVKHTTENVTDPNAGSEATPSEGSGPDNESGAIPSDDTTDDTAQSTASQNAA